ncbi:hypothetical protein DB30_02398 [Enhygromyxa salina]|uniref:Outer membrane protein beta-barrel domain-containing protein n=1 Tax=Enhygromyxa salina TaxID=215803 RepID=A0A0C2CKU9_9BACT|nr:hypothetical protein [Enhygromyxa salina]KIG11846.1 hypothetical protein DB30_02398 [Enhygromyxa salina]
MSGQQRSDRLARRGPIALALLMCVGGWGPPTGTQAEAPAPPARTPEPFGEVPRDPDDASFMSPPNNQLGQWSAGRQRPITRGFDDDHHLQLTAVPTYAAFRVPFIGRGSTPLRGGGVGLELDVRVLRWLFLRAYASHTIHPVFEETGFDEDANEVVLLANGGLVQATNTGIAVVYALDIGRFVPRVDVGAGLLFVRSPSAAQPGQWGAECRQGGVCDLGLSCSADELCQPTPLPEVHAGVGLDILLGQRWAVGLSLRYYAMIRALAQLPVYVHGSVRLSVRF